MGLNAQLSTEDIDKDFKKIEWIIGDWSRTNSKPGISNTERWSKLSDSELTGYGVTLRERDTIMIEKLKIIKRDNNIFFVADIKENPTPVFFKLTKINDNEFVCENPDHDFPKMIVYKKEGNKLKATISGDGKFIDYFFEK